MVYVGDKKYACESCIKGHRSSTCRHIDRPLYEIKAKGRPVTQCEHCRQLRKTKQIHVKCTCGGKDELERIATREGSKSTPVPAFPNGLPEALRTPGMMHIVSDGSESEHSNPSSSHTGVPKRREKARERPSSRNSRHAEGSQASRPTEPGGLVARAHPKDLRPVLPKASPEPRSPHGASERDYPRSSQQHTSASRMSEQPGHRLHDHAGGSTAMMSMSALGDSSQPWDFDIPLDNIPNSAWTPSSDLGDTFDVESFHALYGCGPACPCQRNFPYAGTTSGPVSPPGPSYPSATGPWMDARSQQGRSQWASPSRPFAPAGTQLDPSQPPFPAQLSPQNPSFAFSQALPSGASIQGRGRGRYNPPPTSEPSQWCGQCGQPLGSCLCSAATTSRAQLEGAYSDHRGMYQPGPQYAGGYEGGMQTRQDPNVGAGGRFSDASYTNMSRDSSFSSGSSHHSSTTSSGSPSSTNMGGYNWPS